MKQQQKQKQKPNKVLQSVPLHEPYAKIQVLKN